jgi:hypothetical protein
VQKERAPQDQTPLKSNISSLPIPLQLNNVANSKQTQKLPSGGEKELHQPSRVSMRREERPCNDFVIVLQLRHLHL